MVRMPAIFMAHGGGPMPLLGDPAHSSLITWLRSAAPPVKPEAIVLVSAHWEAQNPTVGSGEKPDLIYDYYGFPPESYSIKYPAPGHPQLAHRVASLLRGSGFPAVEDSRRGFDHGVFVPLKLVYPNADIPVVTLSLLSSLDPAAHIKMGEALAPLRDEGVLLIGSGFSFHNLGAIMRNRANFKQASEDFDEGLKDLVTSRQMSAEDRKEGLRNWERLPHARDCHPREEHLLPLMVCLGAARGEAGRAVYNDYVFGLKNSAFQFDS
eukprot:TRINITY_DN1150_c0_g1_i1.p1 TRINITY_DN1150_c0_g1~~TRINITY_DN1150_c0_g1_i1.p1  ORF type:complete len:266 (-),score=40.89 TRINITY_DN1150_c0_g1_i1:511-1308(-)